MKKNIVFMVLQLICLTAICYAFDPLALQRLETTKECEDCNFTKTQFNGRI
jgi:hypothetical protein